MCVRFLIDALFGAFSFVVSARLRRPVAPPAPPLFRPAAELDYDYVPPGEKGLRGGLEHRYNGIGFMIGYWMGRYHHLW